MGFPVFVEDGRISLIEGSCFGDASTAAIDFGQAGFDLEPWSSAERMLGK